jgi:hypothetical protein
MESDELTYTIGRSRAGCRLDQTWFDLKSLELKLQVQAAYISHVIP